MVKKYKKDSLVSYTLGITLTIELLEKKREHVNKVFVHSKINKSEGFNKIENLCHQNKIPLIYNDKVFNILSHKENCFIIGEFNKYANIITDNANHIILVNPANLGNLGTIMRTMLGFNYKDLIIINPAVDSFDPLSIRASMGAVFSLNIKYYDDFSQYIKDFKMRTVYPLMLQAKESVANNKKEEPFSLVFGNEATGLDDKFLKYGKPLIINHSNDIDSLNLPIAVGITMYEFSKTTFNKKA